MNLRFNINNVETMISLLKEMERDYSRKAREYRTTANLARRHHVALRAMATGGQQLQEIVSNPAIIKPGDPRWRDIPQNPD